MLSLVTALLVFVIVYHHVGYPLILKWVRRRAEPPTTRQEISSELARVAVLMPAHNEGAVIGEKIENLLNLDYPADRLSITIVCDGSTDGTAEIAERAIAEAGAEDRFTVIRQRPNIGKIAVLNRYLPNLEGDVVALTDVSADIAPDAFCRAVEHFADPNVGVVAATYKLASPGHVGEAAYWRYQTAVKMGEAALGAPLGAHGALYFLRQGLAELLPPDTINDDFILPMKIVENGHRAIYDERIVSSELECADISLDQRRRRRIAAGNMQQLLRMPALLHPRMRGVAFAFASGKALRAIMPFIIIAVFFGMGVLSVSSEIWAGAFTCALAATSFVVVRHVVPSWRAPKILDWVYYAAIGHFNGLIGATRYLLGLEGAAWSRASQVEEPNALKANHPSNRVPVAKRSFDVVAALVGLAVGSIVSPIIAVAIKLDSSGPVLFKQLRVGRSLPHVTELFWMYKFRTMRTDAEKESGPVWASKQDPRITKVGRFLRKSRLDEIPQLMNVLKGEMSIIGPRPERPGIFNKLEHEIPFYAERIYGVRPGITGLAQVFQGYDETIDDVRSKVSYDHAYAASLWSLAGWARMEAEIIVRTIGVMVGLRGR